MGKGRSKDDKWYFSFLPNNMAGGSTSPLIPLFVTEGLAGTVAQVGLISALSSLAAIPSNIMWGNLSDAAKKRRLFVLIGFAGLALSLLMMAFSVNFFQYLIANAVLGLLSTAAAPVGTVLILESFKEEEWAKRLGDFSKIGGIGWVVGLTVGTVWIATFSTSANPALTMRALFVMAAGLSMVSMFLAYRWVPEPGAVLDRSKIVNGSILRTPLYVFERARYLPHRMIHVLKLSSGRVSVKNIPTNLRMYYVYVMIVFTGFLSFYVGLPIFLKQYAGMSSTEVFIIYLASSIASALTYSQAGHWATRVGSKRVQTLAVAGRVFLFPAFFLVTMLGLSHAALLTAFCVLHALLGFCWANISVSGSHIVSNVCLKEHRAEATGLYSAVQGAANVIGALFGGFVAQQMGYNVVFVISSVLLIAGLVLLSRISTEKVVEGASTPCPA